MSNCIKILSLIVLLGIFSAPSWAKEDDPRDQIILLNDCAFLLENINAQMSKDLTQWADDNEKILENKNSGEDLPPAPSPEVIKKQQVQHIKLLKDTAHIIEQSYPQMAKNLIKMADAMTLKGTS